MLLPECTGKGLKAMLFSEELDAVVLPLLCS